MLKELIISDFAIIEQLHIQFATGFNVLTGETGAGKSIIIDAVSVLLGERVDSEMIRAQATSALVEGIFELQGTMLAPLQAFLDQEGLEADAPGALVLSREIRQNGRHLCRVNGRVVTLSVFRDITEQLIDIHGQGDHMSLFRVKQHLAVLDRYGDLAELRQQMANLFRQIRQIRRELNQLLQDERETARQVDLLSYQVGEISAALLKPGEDEELQAERNRLANAEHLIELATESYRALQEGEDGQMSALDLVGVAVRNLHSLVRIDPELGQYQQVAEAVEAQIEDLIHALRSYCDDVEYNPTRLQEVEERFNLIINLKRKYGETIEDILAYAKDARRKLDAISHSGERVDELREEERRCLQTGALVAAELSQSRREIGKTLAEDLERELADLRMEQARFHVALTQTESAEGLPSGESRFAFNETGYDNVEFLISANLGEPLRPLVKTASGGEAARLMLALKVVLTTADPVPTLIFDEVDAGIGGRIGLVVGRKLWELTGGHQVLCVTHLPQIAAFADVHYRVHKEVSHGRAQTQVTLLDDTERIHELAQMFGSETEVTQRNAKEMTEQVATEKARVRRLTPHTPPQSD